MPKKAKKSSKGLKIRTVMSGTLLAMYVAFRAIYDPFASLVQAEAGVNQFSNDTVEVGLALLFSQQNMPVTIATTILVLALAVIWLPFVFKQGEK